MLNAIIFVQLIGLSVAVIFSASAGIVSIYKGGKIRHVGYIPKTTKHDHQ